MSHPYQDRSITSYIKNVRSQMNQISSVYEEPDPPLKDYLQDKYEKSKYSPFNSGNTFSNVYENSDADEDYKEETSNVYTKSNSKIYEKSQDEYLKNHALESRIAY
jgi:hypothetical protein